MKIIIEGKELNQALEAWVNKLGVNTDNKHVEVNFTAGRGVNGNSATVDITEGDSNVTGIPTPRVTSEMPEEAVKDEASNDAEEEEPADSTNIFAQ